MAFTAAASRLSAPACAISLVEQAARAARKAWSLSGGQKLLVSHAPDPVSIPHLDPDVPPARGPSHPTLFNSPMSQPDHKAAFEAPTYRHSCPAVAWCCTLTSLRSSRSSPPKVPTSDRPAGRRQAARYSLFRDEREFDTWSMLLSLTATTRSYRRHPPATCPSGTRRRSAHDPGG